MRLANTGLERRLAAYTDPSACWHWSAHKTRDGYGKIWFRGNHGYLAHRAVYELRVGAIPVGMEIDHLCKSRDCVNPAHLEAVTRQENIARSDGPSAVCARKTHCKHGHPFNEINTYTNSGKRRDCRTCGRERTRRYNTKRDGA